MFEIQTKFLHGWENVHHEEGTPVVFHTLEDAHNEITDHFKAMDSQGMDYNPKDYRIIKWQTVWIGGYCK